jgi:hypothetical protein
MRSIALYFILALVISSSTFESSASTSKVHSRVKTVLESCPQQDWVPWAKNLLNDVRHGEERFDLPCNICLAVAEALIGDVSDGIPVQEIINGIVPLCSFLVWDRDVCVGLLNANVVSFK